MKALLPLALLSLTGCVAIDAKGSLAVHDTIACPAGEDRREVAQLFFGRNIGQTVGVSEADFASFLDREVSPRFPDGFTVQDGQGRWLYKGVVYNEPSKVLQLILPGRPDDRAKIAEITAAYERQYRQDAVLSQIQSACISFWLAKKP